MSCISCEAKYRCPDAFRPHAIGCNNYNKNETDNYDIEPYDIMFDMERTVNQILWEHIMGDLGFDWDNTYENDTFIVKAYDWSDVEDANDWHFWHKPSGFKLQWYKYPLRGVMCNMKITHEQFADILYDCRNSMEEGKSFKYLHEVDKWWARYGN